MAVGLSFPQKLLPVPGIRLASTMAGIRYANRPDLALFEMIHGTQAAGVFTRNAFCAAPVIVARAHLATQMPRFLLINTGNANAGAGERGIEDARASCQLVAERAACPLEAIIPFSTGVIGEPLPVQRFATAIDSLLLDLDADHWLETARAIMTTDTVPKGISRRINIDGIPVTITGIAKGSGMIHPDMATLLAFIATDAELPGQLLRDMLIAVMEDSFNSITVDGDTSTNDSCVLLATGVSGVALDSPESAGYLGFQQALREVCRFLAQAIVRDGEGATKFVEICIKGAMNRAEARRVAFTVAHSPLVKTALSASDPNWGRILAAVGRAGLADLDIQQVELRIGDTQIVEQGARAAGYSEEKGLAAMSGSEIQIHIGLGRGSAGARIWTTDLTAEYVRINAEYRS